ncbi:MAG: CbiX/SirB N-terminal domain-containing protein [Pirellulaceae bacterium]
MNIGYLLIGHGTRLTAGQDQFRAVFGQFTENLQARSRTPKLSGLAFLELAEPDIPTAIADLAKRGADALIVLPVLLFSAGHAEQDIPQAVFAAAATWGLPVLAQSPPLQFAEAVLKLSTQRFREAVCGNPCAATCQNKFCSQVALAMIGRGSNSDDATAAMRRFTEMRIASTPVAMHRTGFIHAQRPSVSEAFDEVSDSNLPVVVVQPHLLFEGLLVEQLRREVAVRQEKQPERRWVITETLGSGCEHQDASLAEALVTIALDTTLQSLTRTP